MHNAHCTMHTAHCKIHNARHTLQNWACYPQVGDQSPHVEATVTLNGRLDPALTTWMKVSHCILYTVYCTLYTVYCKLYTVYCTVYSVHCTLQTVHSQLQTVHCTCMSCKMHSSTLQCSDKYFCCVWKFKVFKETCNLSLLLTVYYFNKN